MSSTNGHRYPQGRHMPALRCASNHYPAVPTGRGRSRHFEGGGEGGGGGGGESTLIIAL